MVQTLRAQTSRVAIVDDHPLVVDALARHLAAVPLTDVVFTGVDLEQLLAEWPDPAIVLLDLDLGSRTVSAYDVSRILDRGARVLVVSAVANLQLVRDLLQAGVSGVISKAEPLDEVVRALDAVIEWDDYLSPIVMAAIASSPAMLDPVLSEQEKRVMALYASGLKISAVARRLDISPHTVKDYLRRIRTKFQAVGRYAPTQVHLYQEAVRLGLLDD